MSERVIVDTSVLIALEKLGLLALLCDLYDMVILPEGVFAEFGHVGIDCYSRIDVDSKLTAVLISDLNLGRGESEVIALAYESNARVLIDDLKARKVANDFGLTVSGTIGLLLRAERDGLIASALEEVENLEKAGFYVSDELLAEIARRRGKDT